ncbi:unnamed protein product [Blepharisma stoltei]|uniref:Uncharacterized protein n=1 Tax=Blepharisma stoltei TaxID=1481888 RepID=A0AAU9K8Z6_9CILI|nr:unnamed protein product [Blepharisma stoltei]
MGSTSSEIVSRVETLDLEALTKSIGSDLEVANDLRLIFNTPKLTSRSDLDNYAIPGYSKVKGKAVENSTDQEEAMVYSLDFPENLREKHGDTIKNLIQEIVKNRPDDEIPSSAISKLQGICRSLEGLLKLDKFQKLKKAAQEQAATAKPSASSFALEILLDLIKSIDGVNHFYSSVVQKVDKFLSEASFLSFQPTDANTGKSLDSISKFLQVVLSKEIKNVEENDITQSLSALFALATGTGSLTSALGLAIKNLETDQNWLTREQLEMIWKKLKEFKKLKATLIQEKLRWAAPKDAYQPIVVEDEGVLVRATQESSENWLFVLSEKEFKSGVHYFELLLEEFPSEACLIGVAESNYENTTHQKICYSANSSISSNNNQIYEWQHFSKGDKIGLLLNMDEKTVTFYKNGEKEPQGSHGPLPETTRLFVSLGSLIKVRSFEITQYSEDLINSMQLDKAHETSEFRDSNAYKLLENDEVPDDWFNINPAEIGAFIVNKLACVNADILTLLEKRDPKAEIPKRKDLTLDYQFLTLDQLDRLLDILAAAYKSGDSKLSAEGYIQAISSTIQLIRTQILASSYHQDKEVGDEIRDKILNHLKLILSEIPDSKASEEASKTISFGFDFYYDEPKERLAYLVTGLKQKYGGELQDNTARILIDGVISEMSTAEKLLTAFECKSEKEFQTIDKFMDLLVDLGSESSAGTLFRDQALDRSLVGLIEASQAALLTSVAKSNSHQDWLKIFLKYSRKLIEASTKLTEGLLERYPTGEVPDEISANFSDTIFGHPLEGLLYALPLIKMDLSCNSKILEVLLSYLSKVNLIKSKPAVLALATGSKTEIYESSHPYENCLDTTKLVKVPNAIKYILTFDPQFQTENSCDHLKLYLDENRTNELRSFTGTDFPRESLEIKSPLLFFAFHSDGSVSYWGWKIEIKAVCKVSYLDKQWPDTIKDAASIVLESISSNLISGQWDLNAEDEEAAKLLDNPLLKYGIDETALLSANNELSEDLKNLAKLTTFKDNAQDYSDALKKKALTGKSASVSLESYALSYKQRPEEARFSYIPFLQELIEGSERVKTGWAKLKKQSGVVGPSTRIGGDEMDQAERAIFAVYIAFFEVVDTVNKLFDESEDLGKTLKYIIKQSNLIRGWAQKHKQNLMDSGKPDITYTDISNDIVTKCTLLLGADYKLSLNELGVSKVMKNLLSSVVKIQAKESGGLKAGSKWKSVKEAVHSSSKLKGLVQLSSKTSEPENEDIKEFHKVSDLVTKFLETSIPVELIIKLIEGRRGRAVTRSVGFQLISNMIASTDQSISLVKVFSDSLKVKGEKKHYWEGLEGIDPKLLHIVKHSFYQLYSTLQKELTKPQTKTLQPTDIYYYLFLLEAMSSPFKGIDSHSILEQHFPTVLAQLLKWAKGFINLEELQRRFKKELCVTKLEIHPEAEIPEGTDKILLSESPEGAKVYLTFHKDQSLKALTDVVISTDQAKEGYEKIDGEFVESGDTKFVFVKRGEEKSGERCLLVSPSINDFKYSNYDELFDADIDGEIKDRTELKAKLCRTSWSLFKQFFYSIAGSWVEPNETKKILVQDTFMQVLFNDLKYEKSLSALESESLEVKKLVRGDDWIGKKVESKNLAKNPVHEWLNQFRHETEGFENFTLRNLINEYIEKVDPSMKGVLTQDDLEHIEQPILETLQSHEENKNYKGQYDFFKFLGTLKDLSNEFPENVQNYLSSSVLWKYLPYDFYDAQKFYDLTDVKAVIEAFASRFRTVEGESFMKYIELFRSSEHPGIISQDKVPENTPSEFKDETGSIDFYLLIKTINSNREKFANIYTEIQDSLAMYGEWPTSCRATSKVVAEHADYIGSLLWVVYGCLGSKCLPKLLARESYIKSLLQLTFAVPSEKIITIGARILKYVVGSQHSPESTINWFDDIFNIIEENRGDYISSILMRIGDGFTWYEKENLKKHKLRWVYEGKNLLLSLIEVERWRRRVVMSIVDALEDASSSVRNGYRVTPKAIGAISFLASVSKGFDGFGEEPIVLANAKLSNSLLPKGIIREINGTNAAFYSVSEDTSATEAMEKIENIEQQVSINLFSIISSEEKDTLSVSLITLWENFQDYDDSLDLSYSSQSYAFQRTLYRSLENATLGAIVDIFESNDQSSEIVEKIAERILKRKPLAPKYTSKAMYSNILKQLATKIHSSSHGENKPEAVPLTEESAQARIGALNEEEQILATELLSLDIPAIRIIKCFDAGIKDKEGILNWQEPPKPEKEQVQLYKLASSKSLATKGSRKSVIYQDECANLTIRSLLEGINEKSEISVKLDGSIFNSLTTEPNSITILATLEYQLSDDSVNCGLKIGDLELGIKKTDELYFTINGETTEKLNETEKLFVRVYAKARGQVYITVEGHTFEKINLSIFNGVKVGDFGIYLEKGKIVTLLGFEIYEGLYEGSAKAEIARPKELEGGEQFVRVFNKLSNAAQKQLALIGLTENLQHDSEGDVDLSASIDYAFEHLEADDAKALCLDYDKRVINDVKIFDSKDQVPKDYTIAQVYADEYPIDFDFANIKVLAFNKDLPLETFLSDIAIEGEPSSYTNIGNLSNEQNRSCNVFQQSSKKSPIYDIALFKVTDPYNVNLPIGYRLITDKDNKAINIAPSSEKTYYLFVGFKKSSLILNCSVSSLSSIASKASSFGLTDKTADAKSSVNKIEDERNYNLYSLIELYNALYDVEELRNFSASKKILLSILKKNPNILANPDRLNKSFTFIGNDYKQLETTVASLLKSSEEFRKLCVKEFVVKTVSGLIPKSTAELKPLVIESPHPYNNSTDLDECISIPGADKLKIVFDPQCKTENGCDPLRFYAAPGRGDELKCFSGEGETNWQSFEVEGDTVYTFFHSDGSVNYWGYKFDVIPIGGGSSGEISSPPELATWLLERLVELLGTEFDSRVLFSSRVIQPLFLRTISSKSESDEKLRAISLLKSLLKVPNSTNYEIVRYLISEATQLYKKFNQSNQTSSFLQALIPLLSEFTKTLYDGPLDKWFADLNELVSWMKGLAEKDEGLALLIFDEFKSQLEEKTALTYESSHPYERQTKVEKIHIPLASSLKLEFDTQSLVEPSDNIYFSYDPEGASPACFATGSADYQFLNSPKGPDIEIRNSGKTVTRTNSSGWGNVLLSQVMTKGKTKITYKVDSDGGSSCLFIGFARGPDSNRLNLTEAVTESYMNGEGSWTWNQGGAFIRPGVRDERSMPYVTNDLISFLVDFGDRTITCYKNGNEVYKYTEIAESLIPVLCFGGSNQIISIEKIEVFGALELNEKKAEFKGDTIYAWHPANVGSLLSHQWSKDESIRISDEERTITKVENSASVHTTAHLLKSGKHFVESMVNSEGRIGLGFALKSSIEAKNAEQSSLLVFSDVEGFATNDNIGSYIDFDAKEFKIFKNGELLVSKELPKLENENDGYQYAVIFSGSNQSVAISNKPSTPAGIDIINIHSEANSALWGYKFKVTPLFKLKTVQDINTFLAFAGDETKTLWNETYLPKFSHFFKSGAAEQLVIYLDEMTQSKGKDILKLKDDDIDPSESELIYYPELEKLSKDDMKQLYRILQKFNQKTNELLGLFDIHFESYQSMTELQKALAGSRNYIFFRIKNNLLKEHLSKSVYGNRQSITIDRPKAARHRDRKDVDALGQFSIFGQIYRNTISWQNTEFRNSERFYQVSYRGEAAIDAGGPYNESMSNMCDELQSSYLRLLVPSPNNVHNIGENRESWIVNPAADSQQDIELFTFLGKLMGAAIRTQNNLNLSFPPLFWKRLIMDKLSTQDLRGLDVCIVQILEILRNPEANQLTPDTFSMVYDEKFTTKDSSGREVELIEGGKEIQVTYENAAKYADLIEQYRLNENPKAYEAIRKGMSAVIPTDFLNLFSWKQVETLVCGAANIDIDILKANTDYSNCSLTDQHIINLWEVLTEMSPKERTLFLKFVWGRSKLPSGRDWRHMTITRYNPSGNVDNYMPISHTCFFTMDLPPYTTKEVMKTKLLYAITHCTDIDLDGSASGGWEEED